MPDHQVSDLLTEALKYLSVAGTCALKVVPGVFLAIGLGMGMFAQFVVTTAGGIAGIVFFTIFGDGIRRWWAGTFQKNKPPKPHNPNSLVNRIWRRFGMVGVAILTPPMLSPPVGAAVSVAFGVPRGKAILYMSISMVVWGIIFALFGVPIKALMEQVSAVVAGWW